MHSKRTFSTNDLFLSLGEKMRRGMCVRVRGDIFGMPHSLCWSLWIESPSLYLSSLVCHACYFSLGPTHTLTSTHTYAYKLRKIDSVTHHSARVLTEVNTGAMCTRGTLSITWVLQTNTRTDALFLLEISLSYIHKLPHIHRHTHLHTVK